MYFLVPGVIAQVFIPIAELVIPAGVATNEAIGEIEAQPVTVGAKMSSCNTYMSFYTFH